MIRPLVLLSGGIESTYLLQTLVKTTDVDILYVELPKKADNKNAIKNIIYSVTQDESYKGKIINYYTREAQPINFVGKPDTVHLLQILQAAISVVDPTEHSGVYIGGNGQSTVIENRDAVVQLWNSMIRLSKGRIVQLFDQLRPLGLTDIISSIDEKLLFTVSYCERPMTNVLPTGTLNTACQLCPSCKRVEAALNLIKYKNINENIDLVKKLETIHYSLA